MSIGNAVQRGHIVYVYDEKNHQIFSTAAGNGPDDGLKGYTSSRVNVRRGSIILILCWGFPLALTETLKG
ncbi:MAG: hypothetical protein CR217_14200 [Beijerinckiaceae bacterium]|nr:MAG: hypothetical protein CR217_14200 [Beijerinckiaceae bacterium]